MLIAHHRESECLPQNAVVPAFLTRLCAAVILLLADLAAFLHNICCVKPSVV